MHNHRSAVWLVLLALFAVACTPDALPAEPDPRLAPRLGNPSCAQSPAWYEISHWRVVNRDEALSLAVGERVGVTQTADATKWALVDAAGVPRLVDLPTVDRLYRASCRRRDWRFKRDVFAYTKPGKAADGRGVFVHEGTTATLTGAVEVDRETFYRIELAERESFIARATLLDGADPLPFVRGWRSAGSWGYFRMCGPAAVHGEGPDEPLVRGDYVAALETIHPGNDRVYGSEDDAVLIRHFAGPEADADSRWGIVSAYALRQRRCWFGPRD
jgi:hypothetical protein